MWLKKTVIAKILKQNKLTPAELAKEFDEPLWKIEEIISGKWQAEMDVAELFMSAFGAEEMIRAIDFTKRYIA